MSLEFFFQSSEESCLARICVLFPTLHLPFYFFNMPHVKKYCTEKSCVCTALFSVYYSNLDDLRKFCHKNKLSAFLVMKRSFAYSCITQTPGVSPLCN